ncbi:alpha/beta fold hydrolase [Novipirellula artificiosorum]|uniref:2-hydroxy-6-oxo-6-(2'-aminophenyl)hexa-2, 4-dienoic acid hydrolase n=1 Tax=Novipirellula artificiosorum TaxID=2528016 RepID=A0A5C6DDL9_9BACT|nr:alpha/beta hydrolase [Novipirellula artificiosorum]TWU34842.1 2-hydroxy-6-oxo-6-(2'-aminophenyl)hexa-2,4-dienoic acid hydrolase [Novipirellula artificiosorum]
MRHNRLICLAAMLLSFGTFLALESAYAENSSPVGEKFTQVDGMEMYYEVHGKGEPLVLLHGFFSSGELWKPFLSELTKDYQVIVPDLRNHGRSTNPAGTFTHRQSAVDVFALLDHLKIKKFRAMGFSTGGMTLLHMATSQPDRVQAMVLFGASSYIPAAPRNYRDLTFEGFSADPELKLLKSQHSRGDDQVRELIRLWYSFEFSFDDMNFTPPYLSTIKANTLIIHGDRDMYFPVRIAAEMYESIPNSYLWIIPNGGHVPNFDEPEQFMKQLQQFFHGDWDKNNAPR